MIAPPRNWSTRAPSGHATAAPPRSAMNSRRFIALTPNPKITGSIACRGRAPQQKRPAVVRCGSFARDRHDRDARSMSASTPIAVKHFHRNETRLRAIRVLTRRSKKSTAIRLLSPTFAQADCTGGRMWTISPALAAVGHQPDVCSGHCWQYRHGGKSRP
jgi:hypothetical protein